MVKALHSLSKITANDIFEQMKSPLNPYNNVFVLWSLDPTNNAPLYAFVHLEYVHFRKYILAEAKHISNAVFRYMIIDKVWYLQKHPTRVNSTTE